MVDRNFLNLGNGHSRQDGLSKWDHSRQVSMYFKYHIPSNQHIPLCVISDLLWYMQHIFPTMFRVVSLTYKANILYSSYHMPSNQHNSLYIWYFIFLSAGSSSFIFGQQAQFLLQMHAEILQIVASSFLLWNLQLPSSQEAGRMLALKTAVCMLPALPSAYHQVLARTIKKHRAS